MSEADFMTDPLVDLGGRFASALIEKLIAARTKYGYDDEQWKKDDWVEACRGQLLLHVAKGDPLDVAAYAAFAWHHGWSLAETEDATEYMKQRIGFGVYQPFSGKGKWELLHQTTVRAAFERLRSTDTEAADVLAVMVWHEALTFNRRLRMGDELLKLAQQGIGVNEDLHRCQSELAAAQKAALDARAEASMLRLAAEQIAALARGSVSRLDCGFCLAVSGKALVHLIHTLDAIPPTAQVLSDRALDMEYALKMQYDYDTFTNFDPLTPEFDEFCATINARYREELGGDTLPDDPGALRAFAHQLRRAIFAEKGWR